MKKAIIGGLLAAATIFGGAGVASADYVSDTSVPGHQKQQRQGKVVNHYTIDGATDPAYDCDYVVNTLGDFGGDPYMNDGKMLNIVRCPDGSVVTYHIFHETHPAFTGERTPIWGSWEYFTTTNGKG